jgi:hypothetical protein
MDLGVCAGTSGAIGLAVQENTIKIFNQQACF